LEHGTLFGYQGWTLRKLSEIDPMLAPTPASPESAGMSKAAFDRLEAHLKRRYIDAGRFPGTQLLVYRRGHVVHNAVQGLADIER
jgi:CubicO group peptidase (beta-lactamase class C family)